MKKTVVNSGAALALVDENFTDRLPERNESSGVSNLPLWLTVPMVAQHLSLGKTKVYELIDSEGLPVVRVGRAVRVPVARFLKWVEEFEQRVMSA